MINNRQAGRRNRGRNNGRQSGGNRGGENGNRIDNRARGNAPQLLEKYRNLARDAQLAGDRVNTEYYLQFADHYFRVIADNRARQEEQQARFRRNDEPLDYDIGEGEGSGEDFALTASGAGDVEEARQGEGRRERNVQRPARHQQQRAEGDAAQQGEEREEKRRPRRAEKIIVNRRVDGDEAVSRDEDRAPAVGEAPAGIDEAAEPKRAPRGRKPRQAKAEQDDGDDAPGLDLAVLPPAIARADNDESEEEQPAPRRRGRRPKTAEAAE